jgi:hypothetical protein
MSDPMTTPVGYADAVASWYQDAPVPDVSETRLSLPLGSLRSLSAVRRRVREFLLTSLGAGEDVPSDVADLVDRSILVVDELASNALRHGALPASLHIADEVGRWVVVVTDGAPERRPTPARERPAGQGGYGLYVIADLTTAHGVHYELDRKMVWVCLPRP